jgi:hypothetical protein
LPEPNRCRVADAQIPSGVNRETRLARNGTDLPDGLNRIQYRAIVGPVNCSIRITFKLCRILLRRHDLAGFSKLKFGKQIGLGCPEVRHVPGRVTDGLLVLPPEVDCGP